MTPTCTPPALKPAWSAALCRLAAAARTLLHRVALPLLLPAAAVAQAEPPATGANSAERYRPQDVQISFTHQGQPLRLAGSYYRPPAGDGPFPLVLLMHGSDADAAGRRQYTRRGYWNTARYFLNRGLAVLYVLRPSYGDSEGPYLEANAASCEAADYGPGFELMADVAVAALGQAATLAQADARRVLLVGHSAGGAAVLAAAARKPPGVVGYINFAGGKGGGEHRPYAPCQADQVGRLFAGYAPRTPPGLWVYAPNDLYFGRDVGAGWHRAFQAAGGQAQLLVTPPAPDDAQGHHIVQRQLNLWIPAVDAYLQGLGLTRPR